MFRPTFGFKNSQKFNIRNEITEEFAVLLYFYLFLYFPTWETTAPPQDLVLLKIRPQIP
jgi:hypothetical protein